jgi:hypothetical protein
LAFRQQAAVGGGTAYLAETHAGGTARSFLLNSKPSAKPNLNSLPCVFRFLGTTFLLDLKMKLSRLFRKLERVPLVHV